MSGLWPLLLWFQRFSFRSLVMLCMLNAIHEIIHLFCCSWHWSKNRWTKTWLEHQEISLQVYWQEITVRLQIAVLLSCRVWPQKICLACCGHLALSKGQCRTLNALTCTMFLAMKANSMQHKIYVYMYIILLYNLVNQSVSSNWSAYISKLSVRQQQQKHEEANTARNDMNEWMTWNSCYSFIHSFIHSFIRSFIHSSSNSTMNNNEWHENN